MALTSRTTLLARYLAMTARWPPLVIPEGPNALPPPWVYDWVQGKDVSRPYGLDELELSAVALEAVLVRLAKKGELLALAEPVRGDAAVATLWDHLREPD